MKKKHIPYVRRPTLLFQIYLWTVWSLVYMHTDVRIIRPHRSTTYSTNTQYYVLIIDGVTWSVCRSVCHDREHCENGWTDRDAVWVANSGWPKEAWASRPHAQGQLWRGKGRPIVKYRDLLLTAVQKRLPIWTDRDAVWAGSGGPKEACVGVHIVASWRIWLNRPCVAAMRPFCQITLTTMSVLLIDWYCNSR